MSPPRTEILATLLEIFPPSPAPCTNSHSSSGVGTDADAEARDGAGDGAGDGEGSGEAAAGADEAEVGDAVAASHEDTRVDEEQLAPLNAESETHGVRIHSMRVQRVSPSLLALHVS